MRTWHRFDEWWKRDAATVCNGFFFLAVAAWILLIVQGASTIIGWLVR